MGRVLLSTLLTIGVFLWLPAGWDIVAAADRSTQITIDAQYDLFPAWSPDGTQIAFSSARSGTTEIWVISSLGGSATRLTTTAAPGESVWPTWSPDGTRIAYSSGWESGNYDIWVVPSAGGVATRLTDDPAHDQAPDWSHDGSRIAFHSGRDGEDNIYVMNDDGTGQTAAMMNTVQEARTPQWEPGDGHIAYAEYEGRYYAIWMVSVGEIEPNTLLVENIEGDQLGGFAWHPGGDTLAYASTANGNWDIWKVHRDGGDPIQITTSAANDMYPAWSPDGSLISFCSDRSGNWDIWVCPSNNSPVEQKSWGSIKALFR